MVSSERWQKSRFETAARKVSERFGRGPKASSRGYDIGAAHLQVAKTVAAVREKAADMSDDDRKKAEVKAAQREGQVYAKRYRSIVRGAGSPTQCGRSLPTAPTRLSS